MKTDLEILEPKAQAYYGHSFSFFKKEMQQFVLNAMQEARKAENEEVERLKEKLKACDSWNDKLYYENAALIVELKYKNDSKKENIKELYLEWLNGTEADGITFPKWLDEQNIEKLSGKIVVPPTTTKEESKTNKQ